MKLHIIELSSINSTESFGADFWNRKPVGIYIFDFGVYNRPNPDSWTTAFHVDKSLVPVYAEHLNKEVMQKFIDTFDVESNAESAQDRLEDAVKEVETRYRAAFAQELETLRLNSDNEIKAARNGSKGISEDALIKALVVSKNPDLVKFLFSNED